MSTADNDYTASPLRGSLAAKNLQQAEHYYDEWAKTYDQDVQNHSYNGPKYLGQLCEKYVKKDALILCIGAGTGLESIELGRLGYSRLDGHDGSQNMLDIAKKKGLFSRYFCKMLDPAEKTPFADNEYDAQVCIGCFNPGHLNANHVAPLLTSLKTGGYFIIGTRERFVTPAPDFDYPYNLDGKLEELAKEGCIKIVEKTRFENYSEHWPAMFYVLQKL